MADISSMNPHEKAAILLITLGTEHSAAIYKHLSEDEISQLTLRITRIRKVDPEIKEQIINEFYEMCLAQKFVSEGGLGYARDILEKAMGRERAEELLEKISTSIHVRPFDFIRRSDSSQILNLIHNEHPQTIALVMSYMEPKQAAEVLSLLDQNQQVEVATRIAKMGSTSPDYVRAAEEILKDKVSSLGFRDQVAVGGIDSIVQIINALDRGSERNILESLDSHDGELADEIRKHLFVFEDIAKLTDRQIEKINTEVDQKDLVLALKHAKEDVKKAILRNLSKRAQQNIAEEMELLGPLLVRDIEAAQQRIVNTIRRLEDEGQIIIARGDGDEMIV